MTSFRRKSPLNVASFPHSDGAEYDRPTDRLTAMVHARDAVYGTENAIRLIYSLPDTQAI